MQDCRILCGLIFLGSAAWFAFAGAPPAAKATLSQDEQALKQAGVPLDDAGLLDYFRRRTPGAHEQAALKQYVAQLGSSSYSVRSKATSELIKAGRAALPWLRQSLKNKDIETTRRAQHCILIIEQNTRLSLSATASRVLAERQTAEAGAVLLAYLPWVDEGWVEDEVRQSLKRLTLRNGKAADFVTAALDDAQPKRRAAAGWIVGQSSDPLQRRLAWPCLTDEAAAVRFLTASSLLAAGEGAAVPALIELLAQGPADLAWCSEDLLCRVAGEAAPPVWLDDSDNDNGRKVRAAWQAWWKTHAATIDWKNLRLDADALGMTLIVENQRNDGRGRVYECNAAGTLRWQAILHNPIDAQWLPGGRILVADSRAGQIYEMDTRGTIGWKHAGVTPTSCQRLPNGNTLVSTYQSILEITRAGKVVFTYPTQGHTYHARKLSDGHYVWIDACGEIGEIDEQGKQIVKTKVGAGLTWGSIERLRNGRYLVALGGMNKVREIDLAGKVHWEKTVNNPNRACRLANGHTLVASHGDQCIYEFDSKGEQRWKHDCGGRPFAVQRR